MLDPNSEFEKNAKLPKKPLRIFLGFNDACGYFTKLTAGLNALGARTFLFENTPHPYEYSNKPTNSAIKFVQKVYARSQDKSHCLKAGYLVLERVLKTLMLCWSLTRFDCFIFSFGDSFLGYRDFPVLKLFRKKIVMVYHGNDTRPPYCGGFLSAKASPSRMSDADLVERTRVIRKEISLVETYADAVVCHTACSQFFRKPVVAYLAVGIPHTAPTTNSPSVSKTDNVKIVHAPSCPVVKGSDTFRAAIRKLQQEGHRIEYRELTGMSNREVMQALADCDFALDQLYSDTPMATFAAEAASHGKPSVVAGYNFELLREEHKCPLPPSEFCHPDEVESAIRKLLEPQYRIALGLRAKEFVTKEWSAEAVAAKYLRILADDVPSSWMFDPATSAYLYGAGISAKELQQNLKRIEKTFGLAALGLEGKANLERALQGLIAEPLQGELEQ